ncbi:MAG TPA: hypothetical protein VF524_11760, partial [Polyangia bacterium]
MTNDISTAIRTLRLYAEDAQALDALAGLKIPEPESADAEKLAKTLAAERAFHADSNNPELVIRLIDLEIALARAPAARAGLLVDKARTLWGELWQLESARAALKQALELAPDHSAALAMQRELDVEDASWQEQAETLSAQAADAGERPAAAPLFAAEGELLLRHRSVTEEAEAMIRRSLQLDAQNRRADFALERLLRQAGRSLELGEHLARRIENASTPDNKCAAELAAGRLAEKMGDAGQAREHYRLALMAAPGDERAHFALEHLFAAGGEPSDLIKIYEAALRAAKRGQAEVPVALALGEFYWKRLNKLDEAEQSFRRVKKAQPFHPKVIAFYREYYLSRDEIPQLLTLLGQAQKNETDAEARIRIGIEMATVAERRPQLVEKAIDAWKLLLRIRPGLPEAVEALRRLYSKAEKWNALLELLKEQCEALPAGEIDQKVLCYLDMVP